MNTISVEEINRRYIESPKELALECELAYSRKLTTVADAIRERSAEKPIILLSGPSGSAKTSTALRIENLLDRWGYETHTISMDNYFLSADQTPRAVNGNGEIDFESPYRLDIELLQQHLSELASGKEVRIPIFDFVLQKRAEETIPLRLHPHELILLEGIHALNPEVTGSISASATRLFVNVETQLSYGEDKLMPHELRLVRRMLRDKLCRGRTPHATFCMFNSVTVGENRFIFPYRDNADFSIDTFMAYEPGVYKSRLLSQLEQLFHSYEDYIRLEKIINILNRVESFDLGLVSKASPANEFVRGRITI